MLRSDLYLPSLKVNTLTVACVHLATAGLTRRRNYEHDAGWTVLLAKTGAFVTPFSVHPGSNGGRRHCTWQSCLLMDSPVRLTLTASHKHPNSLAGLKLLRVRVSAVSVS